MSHAAEILLELLSKHTHGSESEHRELAESFVEAIRDEITVEALRVRRDEIPIVGKIQAKGN